MKVKIHYMIDDLSSDYIGQNCFLVATDTPLNFIDMQLYEEMLNIALFEIDDVKSHEWYEVELELKDDGTFDNPNEFFEVISLKEVQP